MEKRIGNIIIQAPGGTAAKNASTYKLSIPSSWVKEMGITQEARQVELHFDGTAITITKKCGMQEFINNAKQKHHRLVILSYYDDDMLCSKIAADYTDRVLCVENNTSNVLRTAFGNNHTPTWGDYLGFLEERCIPGSRAGLRDYLEAIGVDEYDPLEIIKKTSGFMAEDQQWLKVEELK